MKHAIFLISGAVMTALILAALQWGGPIAALVMMIAPIVIIGRVID